MCVIARKALMIMNATATEITTVKATGIKVAKFDTAACPHDVKFVCTDAATVASIITHLLLYGNL